MSKFYGTVVGNANTAATRRDEVQATSECVRNPMTDR